MSTTVLILAGIAVLLMVALARIASLLCDIHSDLCRIYGVLDRFYEIETYPLKQHAIETLKTNPVKKREYWRDQNGFMHWRKKNA
jgi:hypothetical protein